MGGSDDKEDRDAHAMAPVPLHPCFPGLPRGEDRARAMAASASLIMGCRMADPALLHPDAGMRRLRLSRRCVGGLRRIGANLPDYRRTRCAQLDEGCAFLAVVALVRRVNCPKNPPQTASDFRWLDRR